MKTTATSQRLPMKTMNDEEAAHRIAASRNAGRLEYVVVEGPGDGEWTVMHITDAIENDFLYSWRAR